MNHAVNVRIPDTSSSWEAELSLGIDKTARGAVLKRCSHRGPLYVQKPFYPEGRDLAHIYLLHPPGGMVSGDDLRINVETGDEAAALITTPGAGRVYRARPDKALQRQTICLDVKAQSSLEWLPLENIIYPGAYTDLNMDVHLADSARFIGWEITCLGLQASNAPFTQGAINQRLQIFRNGQLKLREKLSLDTAQKNILNSKAGLAGHSVNALLVAGPFDQAPDDNVLDGVREACNAIESLAAVTMNGEFLQVRYLGDCSEEARLLFTRCWKLIRPTLLHRDGCEPRIWAT